MTRDASEWAPGAMRRRTRYYLRRHMASNLRGLGWSHDCLRLGSEALVAGGSQVAKPDRECAVRGGEQRLRTRAACRLDGRMHGLAGRPERKKVRGEMHSDGGEMIRVVTSVTGFVSADFAVRRAQTRTVHVVVGDVLDSATCFAGLLPLRRPAATRRIAALDFLKAS
ncbi:hypothetical protein FA95DRAFT_1351704 [Auriscalpium vulgare]|uniref:Uncharacterized protein n=1 Tax=Auriscalpium vulgare TaxID=40419 RepID=A0ACB8RSP9_9AGAM|nr:hypothetical protein FA95DRAFT_1351704 [Auriscalpium vulgare]